MEMDLISVKSKSLGAGTPGFEAFSQELKEAVNKHMGPITFHKPGSLVGFFTEIKPVPLEQAETIARDFLRIYSEHFDEA